jgi:hypothetical protein
MAMLKKNALCVLFYLIKILQNPKFVQSSILLYYCKNQNYTYERFTNITRAKQF